MGRVGYTEQKYNFFQYLGVGNTEKSAKEVVQIGGKTHVEENRQERIRKRRKKKKKGEWKEDTN